MIEGRGLKGSCSVPAYALAEEPPQARWHELGPANLPQFFSLRKCQPSEMRLTTYVKSVGEGPPSLTKRYEPVFTRLAVVKGSLRLASYQHVRPPSSGLKKPLQPRFRMPPSDKRDTGLPPPHTLAIRKNVGY